MGRQDAGDLAKLEVFIELGLYWIGVASNLCRVFFAVFLFRAEIAFGLLLRGMIMISGWGDINGEL